MFRIFLYAARHPAGFSFGGWRAEALVDFVCGERFAVPVALHQVAAFTTQEIGLFRAFVTVVREVLAAGHLEVPPPTAAQVIWAGGHGVVSLLITKPYFDWVERDQLVKATLDALSKLRSAEEIAAIRA